MYFLEDVESRLDFVYSARDVVRCRKWHQDAGGRGCRRWRFQTSSLGPRSVFTACITRQASLTVAALPLREPRLQKYGLQLLASSINQPW